MTKSGKNRFGMNNQPSISDLDPRDEYKARIEKRRASAAAELHSFRIIGGFRLSALLAGLVLLWPVLGRDISAWWLLTPLATFIGLGVMQERRDERKRRYGRAVAYYERGLARIDDRWAGTGETGERFLKETHSCAADLDLFGKGSLFELLSTARTRAGEETLARWLCEPASVAEVLSRQAAVNELRELLDLREDLSILGASVGAGVHAEALAKWGATPPIIFPKWIRPVAAVLGMFGLLALWLFFTSEFGALVLAAAVLADALFLMRLRRETDRVLAEVELPKADLGLLSETLARIEREKFSSPHLARLNESLRTGGHAPSQQIARLNKLVERLDWRRNLIFAPLAALAMWTVHFAIWIEGWRQENGEAVSRWLAATGEIEALCALATFAYEHPADPFPELVEEGPVFEGEALGHPLIPESRCVRNDLLLGGELRVLIVSGSNMSGKSTLLRTVGTNVVLALAGAPVRAKRLKLSPLSIGASIRIVDSLLAGSSRFYAEITRLRQILDLTSGPRPLLFLLDEILHGTNSHDRRIGAEAVVTGLAERGAIGLVTTHDLALSHIAEALAPRAINVHFEDTLVNGKMIFDYRMRPGVVEKSNAIELMRAVGLEV